MSIFININIGTLIKKKQKQEKDSAGDFAK